MNIDLSRLQTEGRNIASENIDTLSTLDMLTIIN
ncbi:MAG: N-acetylmuramic acid 6-phosphate etherase, partial [Hafniaceae bacterium]|nr:N-acetylmuramic acid 6-phosphate etherase [Hafniaceae bacterium]